MWNAKLDTNSIIILEIGRDFSSTTPQSAVTEPVVWYGQLNKNKNNSEFSAFYGGTLDSENDAT